MRGPGSRPSLLFRLVIPATCVFIVTIFSLIAVLFSDERAPVAKWLNRHGNTLLVAELVVVVLLSLVAMTVDRIQTLRAGSSVNRVGQHSGVTDRSESDTFDSPTSAPFPTMSTDSDVKDSVQARVTDRT